MLDFKIHTNYLSQSKVAPVLSKVLLVFLYTIAAVLVILSPLVDSSHKVSDNQEKNYNLTVLTTTLLVLSFASFYYLRVLITSLTFKQEAFLKIRRKLIFLEVLMQTTIYGRIFAGYYFYLIFPKAVNNGISMIIYISGGLVFSELVPLIVILWGINSQVDWNLKKQLNGSVIS